MGSNPASPTIIDIKELSPLTQLDVAYSIPLIMNLIDRIREYKRLAIILGETGDSGTAATLREMCDTDSKLRPDKHADGLSWLEGQAREFILSITAKARPGTKDSEEILKFKADDILLKSATSSNASELPTEMVIVSRRKIEAERDYKGTTKHLCSLLRRREKFQMSEAFECRKLKFC